MLPKISGGSATNFIVNIVIITLLLVIKTDLVVSSKILILVPVVTSSEKNAFLPLANALGKRGHNVTVAGRYESKYESKNVNEFTILDFKNYMEGFTDPIAMRRMGWKLWYNMEYDFNVEGCERVYQNKNFQLLRKKKFDLIITNYWFHQCLFGFIYEQEVPFIMLTTMPMWSYTQGMTGFRNPTSFVPNPLVSVRDDMSFGERMFNTLFDYHFTAYLHREYIPALENVYKKYLGSHLPSAVEIEKNVSIILSHTHVSSSSPVPMLPDVIEVGGMHCRKPKALPKDLNDYLNGSGEDGFIYFSLGSLIQGKSMPDEYRKIFLNVFSRLKQRVLWKWETEQMEGLPPNVKLGKWLPQQDILGHPKIRMFISHGGMFSTQEAVCHGVPMLGIPIFVDQDMNTRHVDKFGYGKEIEFLDMTEERFETAILELLNNKSYSENAKRQSQRFHDQPQTPTERAVFWTEYVIKHKGAHHLRSAARNLSFIQYHALDVLGVLFLVLLSLLGLVFVIGKRLLKFACGRFCNQKGTKISEKKAQ